MLSLAYVILPFAETPPADAIRSSLARFERGGRGDVPEDWLAFDDETDDLRRAHEARFTFIQEVTEQGRNGGLRIEGDVEMIWYLDGAKVTNEMRRRGLRTWRVRFADTMDLDTFLDCFGRRMQRGPRAGAFGHWRNPLGRWDWWDLGGRFDGAIIGERSRGAGRGVAQVSSGPSPGRSILSNIEDALGAALGQPPVDTIDLRSDRNIELAETLLADLKAGQENACPAALLLPPGAAEDNLRWLDTWPHRGPFEAFALLDLAPDAPWKEVVEAAYARFRDHWVAGVAYHS